MKDKTTSDADLSKAEGGEKLPTHPQVIVGSMGPIVDHTFEHLAPSDRMITQTRRRLLMAARSLHDRGVLPPGVEDADVFRGARSGYLVSGDKTPWQDRQLAASLRSPATPLRWAAPHARH